MLRPWGVQAFGLLVTILVAGCGGGGGNSPSPGTSAAVGAAVGHYFDALRRHDVAGVRAALAPDYSFDGQTVAAVDPFNALFGLTFHSLEYRIETLTTRGSTATASVTAVFQADLNLEPLGAGRPTVNGTVHSDLELEPRGTAWKLVAVRPLRVHYANERTRAPRLFDYTVNGKLSLDVSPGTPLRLSGKCDIGLILVTSVGRASDVRGLNVELEEPWEVTLTAPDTPGRYLAYAFAFTFLRDPQTREIEFLAGDQITIPVTIIAGL